MSFKLLSHPDYLLQKHLQGVYDKGIHIFDRNGIFSEDRALMRLILLFHDLGKASSYFQTYINPNIDEPYSDLKNHAEISANWFFYYTQNILKFSLKDSYLGYVCIKKHHGNIENFRDNANSNLLSKLLEISSGINYLELQEIYNPYFDTATLSAVKFAEFYEATPRVSKFTRKLTKELTDSDMFRLDYLFSILLTADKGDAIWKKEFEEHNKSLLPNSIIDNFKLKFPHKNDLITEIRNKSYQEAESNINAENRIFSMNLPTGSGKTLNLMNAALKMREDENQKIIYCLPFTSVIDQNMNVFEEVLLYNGIEANSDRILKHHHLTDLKYKKNDESYDSNKSEFLIENWESQIVVTTFHQLLLTIFSNRNRMLKKFHALANSIIILDEIQSIPFKYWKLINKSFKMLAELMNIRFILGTATMPLIFDESNEEIIELAKSKKEYFASLNRITIDCKHLSTEMSITDFSEILSDEIGLDPTKSRLVILNTIKSSSELYNVLKEEFGSENLIYLSTNVIPKVRLERINDIRNNPKGKTIISTQLVEAGVDIDIDVVYRDFAPLDSIFQACGRCNRNDSKFKGRVYLMNLINDNGNKFRKFIYSQFLLNQTQNCFKGKLEIEESEFLEISNLYFKNIKENKSETESYKILELMTSLKYEAAFLYPQYKEAFHLIDDFKTVPAFIEVEGSSGILQKYNEFCKMEFEDVFARKSYHKVIRKEMNPYIINVAMKYADQKDGLWIIEKDMLFNKYDDETGFKRDPEIRDYIL